MSGFPAAAGISGVTVTGVAANRSIIQATSATAGAWVTFATAGVADLSAAGAQTFAGSIQAPTIGLGTAPTTTPLVISPSVAPASNLDLSVTSSAGFTVLRVQDSTSGVLARALALGTAAVPSVPSTIATAPPSSNTVRTALGALTIGAAYQNTLSYDVVVTVAVVVTAATAATLAAGVGSTSSPTTDPAIAAFSTPCVVNLTYVVPAGYYLLITDGGTITVGSTTTTASAV